MSGPALAVLAGALALVVLYGWGLRRLRARARARGVPVPVAAPRHPPQPPGTFREAELARYSRHMILREIGGPGQRALRRARVLVVGAGGLGAPALLYLAAAGVGRIGVLDDDVVEESNLQRQVIHAAASVGTKKTASAAAALRALNPHVDIIEHDTRLDAGNAAQLLQEYDLVLDGTDSFATRQIVNAAAVARGIPVVGGMLSQWEGQLSVWDPAGGAPCLACLFPEAPAPGLAPSCAEAGVLGPLPGVIGTMMAAEAVKIVTGAGTPLRGRLLIWDALEAQARVIRIWRSPDCPVCSKG
ncbi:MAG: molybdopterin-synthase adenylyltransferase MoeB [Rubellimicrobium sp.]|nr:molybdopterin-synthase adenylyltransferase MoeB [Rubellimicrobium sp.]